jgi:serine/threonine-protein phosphatase 6 regulatory ankyrin repeat subunit B
MSPHGASLLHRAAILGNIHCVEFLLTKGISASVKDNRGRTPLHYCVANHSFTTDRAKIVKLLLDHGAHMEDKTNCGMPVLHRAAGSMDMVQLLLNLGANVNAKGKLGTSLLHRRAAKLGNIHCVEFLLTKGISASVKDNRGRTPLHYCVANHLFTTDRAKIVKLLLDHGADMEDKTNCGMPVLHRAAVYGTTDMVPLLLNLGANVNAKNKQGDTLLHFASKESKEEIALLLLDHRADVSVRSTAGNTALDVAGSDKMKNIILTHTLGVMSHELQTLRQEYQDLRNFNFAVFGNMDRST